ncbi:LuxR C-terminal-related transcriptional regulator [Mangrovivirga sp. M17]|uniref:LuxR C-terminal-related transcriptional regulator n=1 Tax=Mangrovivirga halotolerans TaxID=2993936 RepID=A0ABT3RS36_9BACT|nr:LuxR C-terminal-related transcriptional regulator [Mangrovivirga halotolerans]MCX2744159.1 LuxR C-terminal-related transcriptional regulator [Mangrovivirga halotolerans]
MIKLKFNPPIVPKRYLDRVELVNKLEDSRSLPLLLVVAPTGYGKSLLISNWIYSLNLKFLWLSLDDEFNNLQVFFEYLITGIKKVFPKDSALLYRNFSQSKFPNFELIKDEVFNFLNEIDKPFKIILDDYFFIKNKEIHNLINEYLKNPVSNVQLIVITRIDPPIITNQLKLYGNMDEIRMNELKFSTNELKKLVQINFPDIKENDLAFKIYENTNGWPLLSQFILTNIPKSKVDNIDSLDLDMHRSNLVNYFNDHIIEYYGSKSILTGFKVASIVGWFSNGLLNYIFDNLSFSLEISSEKLIKISLGNHMLSMTEKKNIKWYRVHHYFQSHFLNNNEEIGELKLEVYSILSKWQETQGDFVKAIDHALNAKEYDRAVNLINRVRKKEVKSNYYWKFQTWKDSFPKHYFEQNISLLFGYLNFLSEIFDIQKMIVIIQDLDELIKNSAEDSDHVYELNIYKAFIEIWINCNPENAIKLLNTKIADFESNQILYYKHCFYESVAYQMSGRGEKGIEKLNERIALIHNNWIQRNHLEAIKIFLHLFKGDLYEARKIADIYRSNLIELDDDYSFLWANYLAGNIAFQLGEYRTALELFRQVASQKSIIQNRIMIDSFIAKSILERYFGFFDKQQDTLDQLKDLIQKTRNNLFSDLPESTENRSELSENNSEKLLKWAYGYRNEPHPSEFHFLIEVPFLTKLKILVIKGEVEESKAAIDELNQIELILNNYHNSYHLVDILVLKAICCAKIENTEGFVAHLNKALDLSVKNGMKRPYIELAQPLEPYFLLYKDNIRHSWWISNLFSSDSQSGSIGTDNSMINQPDLENNFSVRELEIIRAIQDGLRNKEIADSFNISTETVKSHLKNIFKKSGVHSRVELIKTFSK